MSGYCGDDEYDDSDDEMDYEAPANQVPANHGRWEHAEPGFQDYNYYASGESDAINIATNLPLGGGPLIFSHAQQEWRQRQLMDQIDHVRATREALQNQIIAENIDDEGFFSHIGI